MICTYVTIDEIMENTADTTQRTKTDFQYTSILKQFYERGQCKYSSMWVWNENFVEYGKNAILKLHIFSHSIKSSKCRFLTLFVQRIFQKTHKELK